MYIYCVFVTTVCTCCRALITIMYTTVTLHLSDCGSKGRLDCVHGALKSHWCRPLPGGNASQDPWDIIFVSEASEGNEPWAPAAKWRSRHKFWVATVKVLLKHLVMHKKFSHFTHRRLDIFSLISSAMVSNDLSLYVKKIQTFLIIYQPWLFGQVSSAGLAAKWWYIQHQPHKVNK